jgi:hypothetical protein
MGKLLLRVVAIVAAWIAGSCSPARADILLYPIPGLDAAFVLQGKVTTHPGRTLTFRHARFGSLYFGLDEVQVYETPTTGAIASQKLQKAVQEGSAEACLDAGRWALHHGLLPEFYAAASAAWKIDPNHPTVKRLAALKRKIDAPLPASPSQEQKMRDFATSRKPMTFFRSKHFLLLHDTPLTATGTSKKTRAAERLDLLEMVYESFLLKFCLEGYELDVPREQLEVVLFADRDDYLNFGTKKIEEDLSHVSGFYDRRRNVAVFYDQGTNEIYDTLNRMNASLQAQKERAIKDRSSNAKELVRFANTIQLLTEVARENEDIEVVSHETTHQLAGNTGLMPSEAPVPVWAAEGLATYFECPKDAAWSGIGAVNKQRLKWYRMLATLDREHSSIEFVVSDRVFTDAASGEAEMAAYGQAWALTHFLMARHFDKLVKYYLLMAQKRSAGQLPAEENVEAFEQVFGKLDGGLEREWRTYMSSLKTDLQRILDGEQ